LAQVSTGSGCIRPKAILRSDDRDHGYAVVNYRDIELDYGTLADFDRLHAEAHKRGIGVIVDDVHAEDVAPSMSVQYSIYLKANHSAHSPTRARASTKSSKPTQPGERLKPNPRRR